MLWQRQGWAGKLCSKGHESFYGMWLLQKQKKLIQIWGNSDPPLIKRYRKLLGLDPADVQSNPGKMSVVKPIIHHYGLPRNAWNHLQLEDDVPAAARKYLAKKDAWFVPSDCCRFVGLSWIYGSMTLRIHEFLCMVPLNPLVNHHFPHWDCKDCKDEGGYRIFAHTLI